MLKIKLEQSPKLFIHYCSSTEVFVSSPCHLH